MVNGTSLHWYRGFTSRRSFLRKTNDGKVVKHEWEMGLNVKGHQ